MVRAVVAGLGAVAVAAAGPPAVEIPVVLAVLAAEVLAAAEVQAVGNNLTRFRITKSPSPNREGSW